MLRIKFTWNYLRRNYSNLKTPLILGIETSCDDTGCALVDTEGNILGEALNSQHLVHLRNGGIIPPIAQNLHRQNIETVVKEAVEAAKVNFEDVDAIATTVKPGMDCCREGRDVLVKFVLFGRYKKPFIPIHHMEAHALTARMHDKTIEFPFLVLLISGGHCLVAVCKNVGEFLLLGQSLDDAPGEAFDKVARRMKLKHLPEFSTLSGGQAIELAATKSDNPLQYKFTTPMLQYKDCNFSMAGLKNQLLLHLINEERKHDVPPDGTIPHVYNLCAGFQLTITRHLCHRVQRAMEFVELKGLLHDNQKILVVSGGAACNNFIKSGLQIVCDELGYKLVRPPPKLCTDNGVMIAWNGVERWKANEGVVNVDNLDSVDLDKSAPLGKNLIKEVAETNLRCNWVKLTRLNHPQNPLRGTD